MVEVWQKQADTANKVTAAIGAKPDEGGDAAPMKLEDLEGHLNALKEMFIQKQKMMEELEKTAGMYFTVRNLSSVDLESKVKFATCHYSKELG